MDELKTITRNTQMNTMVRLEKRDFTWICPVTKKADFATVVIEYTPDGLLAETLSVEAWLESFRDIMFFQEDLTDLICSRFMMVVRPLTIRVVVSETPGGGVCNTTQCVWVNLGSPIQDNLSNIGSSTIN